MTRHLMAIQIGPVQTFISAARKTRDLWCGSLLLSEISEAVARAVADKCGSLDSVIFPRLAQPVVNKKKVAGFSNVILAVILEGQDAKEVFEAGRTAGKTMWRARAEAAKTFVGDGFVNDELWNQQIDNVLEFYGAWGPLSGSYASSREQLMQRLAGRKALRDFGPYTGAARPKSSLDGGYESVIIQGANGLIDEQVSKWLKLNSDEHLDCAGLTKRLAFATADVEPDFPSVARIAAESWVRMVKNDEAGKKSLSELKALCEVKDCEGKHAVLRRLIHKVEDFGDFPYEGTILYKDRHREFQQELRLKPDDKVTAALNKAIKKVYDICEPNEENKAKKFGWPTPYLAVLRADGDSIGEFLKVLCLHPSSATADTMIQRHQKFSTTLAGIATSARDIVKGHGGVLIYSGGDDFLALVPVATCLNCADDLRKEFCGKLRDAKFESIKDQDLPTLSVGIAIGHFMEPMEWLLEWAGDALKNAKSGTKHAAESTTIHENSAKDGLAIHVHKRGGSPIQCRGRWDWTEKRDEDPNLDDRLRIWIEGWDHQTLSGKLPTELHRIAQEHENMISAAANHPNEVRDLCLSSTRRAVQRMLSRIRPSGGTEKSDSPPAMKLLNTLVENLREVADLRSIANELKSACELAASIKSIAHNEVGR